MGGYTGFANVNVPQFGGLGMIAAQRLGENDKMVREDRERAKTKEDEVDALAQSAFDSWVGGQRGEFQAAIGQISAVDPDRAKKIQENFGEVERTNFQQAGFHIYNAARAEQGSEAETKSLQLAKETLSVRPDHPFAAGLQEILDMPIGTKEEKAKRKEFIDTTLDVAKSWGAFGGYFQEQDKINASNFSSATRATPTPTDIDDFVQRANEESIRVNGRELTPGEKNKAALEFKRAQAKEVHQTREALKEVDAQYEGIIKQNGMLGQQLAEIMSAPALAEAKGEVTPVQKQQKARSRMTTNLAGLTQIYNKLDSMGAMINVEKRGMDNIIAAAKASTVGQGIGRVFGTDAQSERAKINKIIPLLVQDIRQSTDMSARGIDSEKELEFYVQSATDPKTDLQSNYNAIAVLDEAYGDGKLAAMLREAGKLDTAAVDSIRQRGLQILQGGQAKPSQPQIQPVQPAPVVGGPTVPPAVGGTGAPVVPPPTTGAPTTQQPTATATGPNGEKLGLINGQWVPLR